MAGGANGVLLFVIACKAGGQLLALALKALHQAQRLGMAAERETPQRQARAAVVQLQRADAAMVLQPQLQRRRQRPGSPMLAARFARQKTPDGKRHGAGGKVQVGTLVNRQSGQHVLMGSKLCLQGRPTRARKDT